MVIVAIINLSYFSCEETKVNGKQINEGKKDRGVKREKPEEQGEMGGQEDKPEEPQ